MLRKHIYFNVFVDCLGHTTKLLEFVWLSLTGN